MNYDKAIQEIKKKIGTGKGCMFRTQTELGDALGIAKQNISAILNKTKPIPQSMLDIADLERVKHPDTYRRKGK